MWIFEHNFVEDKAKNAGMLSHFKFFNAVNSECRKDVQYILCEQVLKEYQNDKVYICNRRSRFGSG